MKKLLLSAAVVATLIAGCKKDGDKKTETPVNTVPTSFTQKVVLEEYTGAWCGWCVDGHYKMKTMTEANPTKVIGVCVHYGDGMQIASYASFYQPTFSVSGFPTGMINRVGDIGGSGVVMSRNVWETNVNSQMGQTAKCGLQIDASSVSGNTLTVKVTTGFCASVTEALNLTVMLTEDKVTGTGSNYDQHNYYSGNSSYPTHPFYSQPSTIVGYEHNHVLRKIATADGGDAIGTASQKAGMSVTKTYTFDLSGYNKANCAVVAVVNGGGPGATDYKLYNAQNVAVGSIKAWD